MIFMAIPPSGIVYPHTAASWIRWRPWGDRNNARLGKYGGTHGYVHFAPAILLPRGTGTRGFERQVEDGHPRASQGTITALRGIAPPDPILERQGPDRAAAGPRGARARRATQARWSRGSVSLR